MSIAVSARVRISTIRVGRLAKVQKKERYETAKKLAQACAQIFGHALNEGLIENNPAAGISGILKSPKTTHRPCIPAEEFPELLEKITQSAPAQYYQTYAAMMLLMHTFVRTTELIEAPWEEINLDEKIWVPYFKARMLLDVLSVSLMKEYPLIQSNLFYLKESEALEHLESGLLDIYIGLISEKLQKRFYAEKVLESDFIVLCSEKSPLFKKGKINKQEFINTPHIKVSPGFEPSVLDAKLNKQGLLQKTLFTVPDIGAQIVLLRETGYLLLIDRSDAEMIMSGNTFKVLKTDFDLPQISLHAVWHRRKKNDPAHKWLREHLKAACKKNSGR